MMLYWVLILLQIKHFVCDFPLQGPYQYLNKGTYGHSGGFLHAGIHAVATLIVLAILDPRFPLGAGFIIAVEAFAHYHVDWAKMNLNARYGWKCNTSEKFWVLLGFDQLLHQLTYIWIVWMVMP